MARSFDFETKTVMLNSGYEMPILGLGTYCLLDGECVDSVKELLRFGGRFYVLCMSEDIMERLLFSCYT